MGLLPFFKGDLSGTSSGRWGEFTCLYTLTSGTTDIPKPADQWSASYTGNLKITQERDAGFSPVTSLKVLQGPDGLYIERQIGDGKVEIAQLELLLMGGPGAGVLSEDGKVEYRGSIQSGPTVLFQHQVLESS